MALSLLTFFFLWAHQSLSHFYYCDQQKLRRNPSMCLTQHLIIKGHQAAGGGQLAVLIPTMPPRGPGPNKLNKIHKSSGPILKSWVDVSLSFSNDLSTWFEVFISIEQDVLVMTQTSPWPTRRNSRVSLSSITVLASELRLFWIPSRAKVVWSDLPFPGAKVTVLVPLLEN